MKLLLSAYACAPNLGSDHGVGWNWATQAHRLGHEVWVLASSVHRNSIEAACVADPTLRGIEWIFPEVSWWPLSPGVEPKRERTYNLFWQREAIRYVRTLHHRVGLDVIHHLTWAGIRAPTFLGNLGVPLIVGPVGGGEVAPNGLRDAFGLRGRVLERIRDISNATIAFNPIVAGGFRAAKIIFVSTKDTQNLFMGRLRDKMIVFPVVSLNEMPNVPPHSFQAEPRILFAGRLLYWKGAHIAIKAFAKFVRAFPNAVLTIVGDGPERVRLGGSVVAHGISGRVKFIQRVPQTRLFELFSQVIFFYFRASMTAAGSSSWRRLAAVLQSCALISEAHAIL